MIINGFIQKIILIVFLSTFCYYRTIWGSFVFDDTEAIINNADINPNTSVINVFKNDFWGTNITSNKSHKSYRPITVLLFRTLVYFSGSINPIWFHVCNIVLYIFICVTLYILLRILLEDDLVFPTIMLFSVHPVHTEVISSVVGCADLLCALFFFISLILFQFSINRDSFPLFICSLLFVVFATFSKEIGITALGLFIIFDLLQSTKKNLIHRPFITRFFVICVTGCLLLYLRCKVMNFTQPTFQPADNPASFTENNLTKFLTYSYIYFINGLILIWPQWLCFDWSMGCIPLIDNIYDTRIISVVLFWAVGIALFYRIISFCNKNECIGFAFLIVPFIPASNLLFRVGFVIAERILFLPSSGMCILIITGWKKLKRYQILKNYSNIILWLVITTYAFRSHERSTEWLTEQDLFNSALNVCSNNAKVHYNIAKVAGDKGDLKQAELEYRTALKLYPNYDQAMNNLANLLKNNGNLEEAKELLEKAVGLRTDFAAAWMNLGIVYAMLNEDEKAESCYKMALTHRRQYADCFYNLGNLYLKRNQNSGALKMWMRTIELNNKHSAAWSNILVLFDRMERHDKVIEYGTLALESIPNAPTIHFTLANALGKLQKWTEAENHFKRAIILKPENAVYHSNLGVLYHRWGKLDLAENMYRAALKIDPKMNSTAYHLLKITRTNIK